MKWDICKNLHAMSDFGTATEARKAEGYTYGKPHTNNAECYVNVCHRKGICIRALTDIGESINSKKWQIDR